MLRKIKIDQLIPGMYVENLDRSWRSVPVFRNRITSARQVEQLARYRVHEVVIDTEKGIDLPGGGSAPTADAGDSTPTVTGVDPVPYREEISQANTAYEQALVSVSNLMESLQAGERPDLSLAGPAVDGMIASLLRNRDALASLVGLREQSEEVYQHSLRVAIHSMVFATRLGFSRQEMRSIGMGALLHDSGKMRLEPELINVISPLSPEDFAKYRKHPILGARLFDSTRGIDKPSLLVLLQHHERWDGSGFPQGLTGDDISRMARMVMIVDTFDNLTARALAKTKQSPYDAFAWIRDWGVEGFDKKLIDEFENALGLYPVGSFVRLSDNRMAIVMSVHHSPTLKPKLWVVFDINHKMLPNPVIIDLADESAAKVLTIVAAVLPEKFGFDLPGYVKSQNLLESEQNN